MHDRYAILMKLGMGRTPNVAATTSINDLVDACEYYYKKNDAIAYIAGSEIKKDFSVDDKNAIFISDLNVTQNHINLLLVRGDPGRSLPSFVNLKTKVVTPAKNEDPGAVRGASTHVIISKQEIVSGAGRYRTVIEQATGISRTLIRDFLGNLLTRYASDFPEKYEATKKRTKKGELPTTITYRPTVLLLPEKNASLEKDLKEGRIDGFKLVRGQTNFEGDTNDPMMQKLDVSLHVKIIPTDQIEKVYNLVKHIGQHFSQVSFEDMKLELVDSEGQSQNLPGVISVSDMDEPNMRYCKKLKIIGLDKNTTECYSKFHQPIRSFFESVIDKKAHWS